jgi:ribonuclease G
MKDDRAKHTILPLTKFGILQITRQRVRQETSPTEQVNCPLCHGTGSFMQEVPIHEDIEARLIIKIKSMPISNFTLKLNPYLASYFTKGIWSKRWQWFMKYRKWIKIEEVPSTNPYDYELMVN